MDEVSMLNSRRASSTQVVSVADGMAPDETCQGFEVYLCFKR